MILQRFVLGRYNNSNNSGVGLPKPEASGQGGKVFHEAAGAAYPQEKGTPSDGSLFNATRCL